MQLFKHQLFEMTCTADASRAFARLMFCTCVRIYVAILEENRKHLCGEHKSCRDVHPSQNICVQCTEDKHEASWNHRSGMNTRPVPKTALVSWRALDERFVYITHIHRQTEQRPC